jgi:transposase-like protein
MARNKIQFQTGLSLPKFLEQYGTEEQCRQALFQWRWPNGYVCPACGHTEYCELKCRLLFQCNHCHTQTSLTAKTIFAATKLPIATWFLGIYLVTQSKISVSSLSLARTLGVASNTALLMKHKLQQVMKLRDDSKQLSGFVQLDDSYWGGKKHDGNRGRGATGKLPFIAAVSTTDQDHPLSMRFSRVPSFSLNTVEAWAANHLAPGCHVVSDGLGCFKAVGRTGCDHAVIITGGGPNSVKIPEFKWVNTIIGNVKNSLRGTFHAISEKHFHRYLAEFCYRFNRRFDLPQLIPRFCYIALRTQPFPARVLKMAEFHA